MRTFFFYGVIEKRLFDASLFFFSDTTSTVTVSRDETPFSGGKFSSFLPQCLQERSAPAFFFR